MANQERAMHPDTAIGAWPLDRPFPVLLTPADLRCVFQISRTTYHRNRVRGLYRRFEVADIGPLRYSGEKVKAHLAKRDDPPPTHARTFGAKRGPRPTAMAPRRQEVHDARL